MATTAQQEHDVGPRASDTGAAGDEGPGGKQKAARACDACRRMKIRCKIEDEACEACHIAGRACTFLQEGVKRERPPNKKDVEVLNAKIRSLERLLQRVAPGVDLSQLPRTVEQARTIINTTRKTHGDPLESVESESDGDDAPNDPVELSIEPGRYMHPRSALSVGQGTGTVPINQSMAMRLDSHTSWVERKIELDHANRVKDDQLFPPADLARSLVGLYFDHVDRWSPVLHQPAFMELWKANAASYNVAFRSLCYAVFAAAARFSSDPRVRAGLDGESLSTRGAGAVYATASTNFISLPSSPWSIWALQSAAVLSQYLLINSAPTTAWSFTGVALRRAQDVGAHRENSPLWTSTILLDQQRKRAFWTLHSTDRQLHLMLKRPPALRVDDLDLEPPLFLPDEILSELQRDLHSRPLAAVRSTLAAAEAPADRPMFAVWRCWWRIRRELHQKTAEHATPGWDADLVTSTPDSSAEPSQAREFRAHVTSILKDVPESIAFLAAEPDPERYMAGVWHETQMVAMQLLGHRKSIGDPPSSETALACVSCAGKLVSIYESARARGVFEDVSPLSPFHLSAAAMVLSLLYARSAIALPRLAPAILDSLVRAMRLLEVAATTGYIAHRFLLSAREFLRHVQAKVVQDSVRFATGPEVLTLANSLSAIIEPDGSTNAPAPPSAGFFADSFISDLAAGSGGLGTTGY